VAIGTNPGGGTLSGTTTASAVSGVATFSGLSIDRSGTGYTLTAASAALTTATSATFNITAAAPTKVGFTVQPANSTAGVAISPAVQVAVQDSFDNTVTSASATITVAIGTNPGSGTLSGTTTVATSGGVATFSNLSIDKSGTGYTLAATATGLTAATSGNFNVGPPRPPAWLRGPTDERHRRLSALAAVQVAVQDAFGNTVTSSTASVTVAIGANPGGGTLSGTTSVAASAGIASFSNLSIDKSGTGYTLTAAAGA